MLKSNGVMQLGWASHDFRGDSENGDGVGDDAASWAYDGVRQLVWNGALTDGNTDYGLAWSAGDVVGCFLDLGASPNSSASVRYSLNGKDMGVAFTDISASHSSESAAAGFDEGFFPAFSIEEDEALVINVGQRPFLGAPMQLMSDRATFSSVRGAIDKRLQSAMKETETAVAAPYAGEPCAGHTFAAENISPVGAADPPPALVPAGGHGLGVDKPLLQSCPKSTEPTTKAPAPAVPEALCLEEFSEPIELEALGADRLRNALLFLNVKAGGTLQQRAARLLSVKGLRAGEIPPKLLLKKRKR